MHTTSEPRTEHNGALIKQDTAEKVKEIKLRQQNWMKQRTQSLSAGNDHFAGSTNVKVDRCPRLSENDASHDASPVHQPSSHDPSPLHQPSAQSVPGSSRHGRCDDDLSHSETVRCKSNLNTRQRHPHHHQPQQQQRRDAADRSRLISNHFCVNCLQLMIGQSHCPVLVSPCGHTLCEQCSSRQCYCPVCHCLIDSRLNNVALQRVIIEHHQQQQQQQQQTDMCTRSAKDDEEAAENLRLRCDVLSGEEQTLSSRLRELDDQVTDHRRQVNSVESQQHSVQRQINQLTDTMSTLSLHKADVERRCEQLLLERTGVQKKLDLLQTTITQLRTTVASTVTRDCTST